jgi:hypothetical protein
MISILLLLLITHRRHHLTIMLVFGKPVASDDLQCTEQSCVHLYDTERPLVVAVTGQ